MPAATASSWATIFPGLAPHPLRGNPDDHVVARDRARAVATSTATVQAEFSRIRSGPIDELRGGAAAGLAVVIGHVDDSLVNLAPVFTAVEAIFEHHADELARLRREADAALARATARWHAAGASAERHTSERGALAAIDRQLATVRRSTGDDGVDDQIEYWEGRRWTQLGTVAWWHDREGTDRAELEESRVEYVRLGQAEEALVAITHDALRSVPLGDLRDPTGLINAISDFVGGVLGFAGDVLEGAVELVVDGMRALADVLLTVAEALLSFALDALAVAIGIALIAIAGLVLVHLFMALAPLVLTVGAVALLVYSILPPHLQIAVLLQLRQWWTTLFDSSPGGDLGGTYEMDPLGGYTGAPTSDEAGRAALLETLTIIRDGVGGQRIEPDEFALVQLDNGRYIVVLPGVTDLSDPDLGLNEYNRTVRDLDQYAFPSSTSTGIDDNLYAAMVAEALARNGVPPGAEVMIVGHSYGADTALDLAADPRFNGTYQVTHVAAAAYHSGPQVSAVPEGTNVLVLQNTNDMAVQVEAAGHHPVGAVDGYVDAIGTFLSGDLGGGFEHLGESAGHVGSLVTGGNPLGPTTTPNVSQPSPHHTVAVFDGGTEGVGHDPHNYSDYLTSHTSTEVAAFEASVGAGGYAGPGTVYVIDVSVPE